jgi:cyclophilin family peptidyl-prolyl cis-trans isomerase
LDAGLNAPFFANTTTATTTTITTTTTHRRWFGSGGGTRGARGHGWWVNYRAGKGGRHLQGTYAHLDVEAMEMWNDAVFGMGSKMAYLDVKLEALAGADENENKDDGNNTETQKQKKITQTHRLTLELATEALPLATENVLKLLQESLVGYHSTTLHRVEKGVGILGGLVADNPNHQVLNLNAPMSKKKKGMCHPDFRMVTSPTAMDVSSEKLVVHHLEGVITMLQPRIGQIDSRFLLLSSNAPHLDGVSVAIGRLANSESLDAIKNWESTLITSHGVPTNVTLRIVGCGLLEDEESNQTDSSSEAADDTNNGRTKQEHVSMQ